MGPVFTIAGIWLVIAVIAAIVAYHLDISIALVEICLGIAAAAIADRFFGKGSLGSDQDWLKLLASLGAVMLTFLAGAELDPAVIRTKIKEVSVIGLAGFLAPFARRDRGLQVPPGLVRCFQHPGRDCSLDDLHGGRVRGHAGNRAEQDRAGQRHPRGMLRE